MVGAALDNLEKREKLFADLRMEINKRELSNAENFDKAILTYSSAGLGFSLAFLKDVLPITNAKYGWMLYSSWALFTLAIVTTIISYVVSQRALKKLESIGERYYIENDKDAFDAANIWAILTNWFNGLSGLFFVTAIIFTTIFVSMNLERATKMSEQKNISVQGGASVPTMQKLVQPSGLEKAAPVPSMQRIPQEQPPQQQAPQPQAPQQTPPKGASKK
jgi:hypothetical protein